MALDLSLSTSHMWNIKKHRKGITNGPKAMETENWSIELSLPRCGEGARWCVGGDGTVMEGVVLEPSMPEALSLSVLRLTVPKISFFGKTTKMIQ